MLLNNGELDRKRILDRKCVEFLTSPQVKLPDEDGLKISVAFYVSGTPGEEGRLTSLGTYGWGGAFYTTYFIDQHEKLIGVFMSQGWSLDSSIMDRFRVLVYQALR